VPGELVPVMSFVTAPEAEVARNALAEAGIQAFLEGDQVVSALWYLSNAIGGVKVLVAREHAARARRILEGSDTGEQGEPCAEGAAPAAAWPPRGFADEDAVLETDAQDAVARRAWLAAVIGLFLCPPTLNLYSLWLLFRIAFNDAPMSSTGWRRFYGAVLVNLLCFAAIGTFVGLVTLVPSG